MDLEKIKKIDLEKLKSAEFYRENKKTIVIITLGFLFIIFLLYIALISHPRNFPINQIINIKEGSTLEQITFSLDNDGVIRYPSVFKFFVFISGNQKDLIAGDYFFSKKLNLFGVLRRVSKGEYGISPTAVTFPEGSTVLEIGQKLKNKFKDFEEEEFLRLAKDKEGFLFPDTYRFLPNVGPRQIIFEMESNFNQKVKPLLAEIEESGHSLEEIIVMASLLEEEARTQETRDTISGILWKRIEIGMPLQVDAVFPYIIGKNTFQLSLEDLQFDSPYNTYKYLGLPPGAISNPGLSSIESALRPAESDYLFYLSDREGNMHYAEDFEGHKRNKTKYLRR